jgi:hypothetical protein
MVIFFFLVPAYIMLGLFVVRVLSEDLVWMIMQCEQLQLS